MKRSLAHAIELVLICLWGTQLMHCDSWYINYLIIFIASIFCFASNIKTEKTVKTKFEKISIAIFTAIFTAIVLLSNFYKKDVFDIFILIFGSAVVFYHIFKYIAANIKSFVYKDDEWSFENRKKLFITCFLALLLVRLLVLVLCMWPGFVSGDSVDQIGQMLTGNYNDYHPVYHTQFMHLFISIGMQIFGGDLNAGIAVFSICQIIMTSLIMAFSIDTMAKLKAPKWSIIATIIFYAITPYHIMYSFTLWKNVAFSYAVLLLVIFLVRYFKNMGSKKLNIVAAGLSGLIICLFQSNGMFIFALLIISYVLIWRIKHKALLFTLLAALCTGFVMKNVVLGNLGVRPHDTIEALSIPAQQIARVIADGKELNEDELSLLNEVIDVDKIPDEYNKHISDPIKHLVRNKANQEKIKENKLEYLKLWISLGIRYPKQYLLAWIDETKGYYDSGGYGTILWVYGVATNDLGIERTLVSENFRDFLSKYFEAYKEIEILKPLVSLGFFTWLFIFCLFIALVKKNKLGIFVALPGLFVVLSLLIATPVYAEFRYMYALFTTLPIVMTVVFMPTSKELEKTPIKK